MHTREWLVAYMRTCFARCMNKISYVRVCIFVRYHFIAAEYEETLPQTLAPFVWFVHTFIKMSQGRTLVLRQEKHMVFACCYLQELDNTLLW